LFCFNYDAKVEAVSGRLNDGSHGSLHFYTIIVSFLVIEKNRIDCGKFAAVKGCICKQKNISRPVNKTYFNRLLRQPCENDDKPHVRI
jgi:hypothetical protein